MSALQTDTIAALATPPGRSSVALFRVSGPDAFTLCDALLRHRKPTEFYATHTLHRAVVLDGIDTVDDVLVAVFHAPRSYTGENVVEITCHGGSVPVGRIAALLARFGARAAEPGEFTLRAYLNGKLDLSQAEAVCDAIEARTVPAHKQALSQQMGALSAAIAAIRECLIGIVARIEASIDFPEDIGEFPAVWCAAELANAAERLSRLIATAHRGILLREGVSVVLAGAPNAGKSSLLNALLRSDRAIVTAIPGTTRDVIDESIDLRGIAVRLSDTAGLRRSGDEIEQMGVARSYDRIAAADLVLHVCDIAGSDAPGDADWPVHAPVLTVWNKIDLLAPSEAPPGGIAVSALTGLGIDDLEDAIYTAITASEPTRDGFSDSATVTRARHKAALEDALAAVERASAALDRAEPLDFLSIDIQCALSELGRITGETAPQSIIDEIFSRFCIGK